MFPCKFLGLRAFTWGKQSACLLFGCELFVLTNTTMNPTEYFMLLRLKLNKAEYGSTVCQKIYYAFLIQINQDILDLDCNLLLL